jgi:hypothetical protein
MPSDPDGLWPRRADAASDGVDEDREVDDIGLTLEEDLPLEDEDADDIDWMADADQRPVEIDDEDRDVGAEEIDVER